MSTPIKDGGPAFPAPAYAANITDKGMTLRDYFAGQALAHIPALLTVNEKNKSVANIADWSYQIADAMLVARKEDSK
jgi:hypothetical protein